VSAPEMSPLDEIGGSAETGAGRNGKLLLVGVGVVFLAIVLLMVLFMGGDEEAVDVTSAADSTPVQAQADEPAEVSPEDGPEGLEPLPVVTYEVFLERDPFDPVVPEDEPTPTAEPGNSDSGDPDDPDAPAPGQPGDQDPDDPSDPDARAPDGTSPRQPRDTVPGERGDGPPEHGAPAGECRGGNEEAVCDGRVVSLVDVTNDSQGSLAVVQVDTTVYEVRSGDRFAQNFEVRAIDGSCVNLLHGDDGFQLCTGDRVLK
jgi:hypothetical protein